jgi:hypothetical protein
MMTDLRNYKMDKKYTKEKEKLVIKIRENSE